MERDDILPPKGNDQAHAVFQSGATIPKDITGQQSTGVPPQFPTQQPYEAVYMNTKNHATQQDVDMASSTPQSPSITQGLSKETENQEAGNVDANATAPQNISLGSFGVPSDVKIGVDPNLDPGSNIDVESNVSDIQTPNSSNIQNSNMKDFGTDSTLQDSNMTGYSNLDKLSTTININQEIDLSGGPNSISEPIAIHFDVDEMIEHDKGVFNDAFLEGQNSDSNNVVDVTHPNFAN